MALTQEMISSFLIEHSGQVRNSELLNAFKDFLNCSDPNEKQQNRNLFKKFVNNIAVVKEIEGVKYVVIKKKHQHLVSGNLAVTAQQSKVGYDSPNTFCSPGYDVEQRDEHKQEEGKTLNSRLEYHNKHTAKNDGVTDNVNRTSSHILMQMGRPGTHNSVNTTEVRPLKSIQEEPLKFKEHSPSGEPRTGKTGPIFAVPADKAQPETQGDEMLIGRTKQDTMLTVAPLTETRKSVPKPCALPLRMPPPEIKIEAVDPRPEDKGSEKGSVEDKSSGKSATEHDIERSPRSKRRTLEENAVPRSPLLRRANKNVKPSDDPRYPETIPLEATEHEWLIKCAAGHWHQVHGLLLQDTHLARKRDFMSGFTALHWAAKCGNSEMVSKIIEIAARGDTKVDINARCHGGYTPLHIAAIHNHGAIMKLLVHNYGAKVHLRDNSGKKAHHYLDKDIPPELRTLLGGTPIMHQETLQDKQDEEHLADLHRGFNTLSRLFQPNGGQKKRYKPRLGYYSISEEPEDDGALRRRPFSDVFL